MSETQGRGRGLTDLNPASPFILRHCMGNYTALLPILRVVPETLSSGRGLPGLDLGPIPLLRVLPGTLWVVAIRGPGLHTLCVNCVYGGRHRALQENFDKRDNL
jgi:hypothetical protein